MIKQHAASYDPVSLYLRSNNKVRFAVLMTPVPVCVSSLQEWIPT